MRPNGVLNGFRYVSLVALALLLDGYVKFSSAQTYAKTTILSGGAPNFIFNSLRKYNDGVVLNGWTRLRLELREDVFLHTGWQLGVSADQSVIQSDGSATLDLDVINIVVESVSNLSNTTISTVLPFVYPLAMSPGPSGHGDVILEGSIDTPSDPVSVELLLSYECGTTTPLLGSVPEYYTVNLIFILYSIP